MTRSKWLDPSSLQAAIALSILLAIANGIWFLPDHTTASWDQANYLWTTVQYKYAFAGADFGELLHVIYNTDPGHGPLFTVAMLPLTYVAGTGPDVAQLLNLLIAPVFYIAAGEIAYIVFRNWTARLLAIALVATTPILVGLFHEMLQDFLLITLCTLALLLLLKSEGFQRRWVSVAMGATMGLATLTKVTFPLFVAGPILVVLARIFYERRAARGSADGEGPDLRAAAANVGLALLAYLLLVLPWYLPNLSETSDYIDSTTGGSLAEGAGPTDPLTLFALARFTIGALNTQISWVLLLVGIAAVAFNWGRLKKVLARPRPVGRLFDLAFVIAWATIPFLTVATSHNQDVRLMAAAIPGMVVLVAGAVSLVRSRAARTTLIVIAVLIPSYQVLNHTVRIDPGFVPDEISIVALNQQALLRLSSAPNGYEESPQKDYVTPIIEYIDDLSVRLPGGPAAHPTVCVLQSEAVINGNTFRYMGSARQDQLNYYDIMYEPEGEDLKTVFERCSFALYVPGQSNVGESRVALVNEQYAGAHMTPELLRLFDGPRRTFPTGEVEEVAGEDQYLKAGGRPDHVQVLVRLGEDG